MRIENLAYKTSVKIFDSRAIAFFIDFLVLASSLFLTSTFFIEIWLTTPIWVIIYYSVTESIFGCTIGKYAKKLRVVDKNGDKPKFYKVFIRALFYFIEFNPITFLLSYIYLKKSKLKQRLGDKVSGIFVVYKKDLNDYKNNEIENSMEFNEFLEYYNEPLITLTKNGSGAFLLDINKQYIEINNIKKKLIGINNLSFDDILNKVNQGARFKCYYTCVSAFLVTQKTTSSIYFIPENKSPLKYHLKYTIITMLLGWWGIPWGIIGTISSILSNFNGGIDVTDEVINIIRSEVQFKTKRESLEFVHNLSKSNNEELKNKFNDMSDYDFKTKYMYNLSKVSPNVGELIKGEDEYRKSKNPNYENYMPEAIDTSYPVLYPEGKYNQGKTSKNKIIQNMIGIIFSILIIFIISAIFSSQDYEQLAIKEYESKNYEKSIQYTDQYLEDHPKDTEALLLKIDSLFLLKRYDDAIVTCNEVDTLSPKNKECYLYIGQCNYNLNKFNESIKWLDKSLAIDTKYTNAYTWKASALNKLNDYNNAIKTIDSLLVFDPNNSNALKIKSEAFLALKNYTEAFKIIERAIEIEPSNIELSINKMEVLYCQKKFSDLIETCTEVNKKFPNNENALWYMGDCYSAKEDHLKAIISYENALRINPKNDNIVTSIAWEYYLLQDYKKATEYTKKALDINADNTSVLELKKDLEEAQKPENVRIADFVKENYLYLDKITNSDTLIDSFSKKTSVNINDIQKFINSIKYKDDKFTFLISGQEYDYMENYKENNHIEVKAINDNTKYIKIYMFTQGTAYEFKDALNQIKDPDKQNLIIDLRDNPGGLAHPTNNILDSLLPECVTSYLIRRDGEIYTYSSDKMQVKFKHIYIFVNQNSASSSELLSLGLKKYLNNITIIGTPTVGKGVGQITFEDKKKKYVLFLVNHYWNVKEKNIMGSNIKPDIIVKGNSDKDYYSKVK